MALALLSPQLLLTYVVFLLLFKYSCLPHPTHPHLQPSILPTLTLSMGPLYIFLYGSSPFLPCCPPPLWLLSVCSLFLCGFLKIDFVNERQEGNSPFFGYVTWVWGSIHCLFPHASFTPFRPAVTLDIHLQPSPSPHEYISHGEDALDYVHGRADLTGFVSRHLS